MRSDMAKVIVDTARQTVTVQPRKNKSYCGWNLAELEQFEDLLPIGGKVPMAPVGSFNDRKIQSDRLNPLRRFLNSRIGREWNLVKSEITRSNRYGHRHLLSYHLWDHIDNLVSFEVTEVIDEIPYLVNGKRLYAYIPFFVHPQTGTLVETPAFVCEEDEEEVTKVTVDDQTIYSLIEGVWYEFKFSPVPNPGQVLFDYGLKLRLYILTDWDKRTCGVTQAKAEYILESEWGIPKFASSKKQLGKEELKVLKARLAK